jgi:hypothetical protein
MADSSTGGYLRPTTEAPPYDIDLDEVLQGVVVGMTGLPDDLVRPRWQPIQPRQPNQDEDWCAVGVTAILPDGNPAISHKSAGEGSSVLTRHEVLETLASFYGPTARSYAAMFRDGLYVSQNREQMFFNGMGLIDVDPIRSAPELLNQNWRRRYDVAFRFRRRVDRTYAILNVLQAAGTIHGDGGSVTGVAAYDQPFTTERNS